MKDPLTRAVIGEWSSEDSELSVAWLTADILRGLQEGNVYAAGEDVDAIAISVGPNNDSGCVLLKSSSSRIQDSPFQR